MSLISWALLVFGDHTDHDDRVFLTTAILSAVAACTRTLTLGQRQRTATVMAALRRHELLEEVIVDDAMGAAVQRLADASRFTMAGGYRTMSQPADRTATVLRMPSRAASHRAS